jgi:Flp pilus assembly protein TadG
MLMKYKKGIQQWLYDNRGQAVVEFSLMLPIMLMVIFGLYNLVMVINVQTSLTYAAREGARMGSITNDDVAIRGVVREALYNYDTTGSKTFIVISPNEYTRTRGDMLRVEVRYLYELPIKVDLPAPFNPTILSQGGFYLNSTALMRVEKK